MQGCQREKLAIVQIKSTQVLKIKILLRYDEQILNLNFLKLQYND